MRNFHADLKRGQQGELEFLKLFSKLIATDGKKGDIMAPDGKVELKTDYYNMKDTQNFFIERYSSVEVCSPGGPWQAKAHGCKYFAYYYKNNGVGFVFEVDSLIEQLEKLEKECLKPSEVKNRKWTTIGYKVPREYLVPLFVFDANGAVQAEELGQQIAAGWK